MIVDEKEILGISGADFVAAGGATGPVETEDTGSGKSFEDLEREDIIRRLKKDFDLSLDSASELPIQQMRNMAAVLLDGNLIADEALLRTTIHQIMVAMDPVHYKPDFETIKNTKDIVLFKAMCRELRKRHQGRLAQKLEMALKRMSIPPSMPT